MAKPSLTVIKGFGFTVPVSDIASEDRIGSGPPPVDPPTGGGDNGAMEARVKALEDSMSLLRTDVAVVRSNYASREDLHKELGSQTWKIIGWVTGLSAGLVAAVYFVATHVK
jgi:hypothetical protein